MSYLDLGNMYMMLYAERGNLLAIIIGVSIASIILSLSDKSLVFLQSDTIANGL